MDTYSSILSVNTVYEHGPRLVSSCMACLSVLQAAAVLLPEILVGCLLDLASTVPAEEWADEVSHSLWLRNSVWGHTPSSERYSHLSGEGSSPAFQHTSTQRGETPSRGFMLSEAERVFGCCFFHDGEGLFYSSHRKSHVACTPKLLWNPTVTVCTLRYPCLIYISPHSLKSDMKCSFRTNLIWINTVCYVSVTCVKIFLHNFWAECCAGGEWHMTF